MDIHQQLNIRHNRTLSNEDKFVGRMAKRWEAAEAMIGKLVRDGKEVLYVWPVGGRYREGLQGDLVNFLIRNNYA